MDLFLKKHHDVHLSMIIIFILWASETGTFSMYSIIFLRFIRVCNSLIFSAEIIILTMTRLPCAHPSFQAIREQFRKNGNVYFLCVGILMFFGYYTPLFDSAITPWTTLGPLAVVVSVSVAQEGYTDIRRHRSDKITNYRPCVVLRRAEEMNQFYHPEMGRKTTRKRDTRLNQGKDMNIKVASQLSSKSKQVSIAFESLYRKNIYAGDLVLVRKREMIPADLILLASSNEGGSAYVETSSIDGETNLKLRHSPHLPLKKQGTLSDASTSSLLSKGAESLENAIERIANISHLGHPDGISAVVNPANNEELPILERRSSISNLTSKGRMARFRKFILGEATNDDIRRSSIPKIGQRASYIAALTSEPPNTHVNNFSGKLTLPPESIGAQSEQAPLNAENILLRGAVLRNTEWVIGLACFTGADTKLVMNSVATPSKFSQLDRLINRIVFLILFLMLVCVMSLGFLAVDHNNRAFNTLWFTGYSKDVTEPWPYFNLEGSSDIPPPVWRSSIPNYIQMVFMFITMLSNFVPLSLYISVEMVTVMMMLYIGWDIDMYHEETDTPAAARSTIVTDLGLVEYIFSDKTGTLTSNIMEFKRCSVDGHTFGMPMSKSAPQVEQQNGDNVDTELVSDSAHPLKNLLASSASPFCLSSVAESNASDDHSSGLECGIEKLTFNAEMFLRVMSICHTVVVEKDTEESEPDKTTNGSIRKKPWGSRSRSATADSNNSAVSNIDSKKKKKKKKSSGQKKKDGAPNGHAYQAESPDEGALVSAASIEYGFQLLGRDSSGVQISCPCPSLFEDKGIVEGVKNGTLTAKELASQTASSDLASSKYLGTPVKTVDEDWVPHAETWSILAINKFDSDRKRMSVLVRSPPELGSLPMLFCKGADSSMLLEGVSEGISAIENMDNKEKLGSDAEGFQISSLLGIQAHLGGKFSQKMLMGFLFGVDQNLSKNCYPICLRICFRRAKNASSWGQAII